MSNSWVGRYVDVEQLVLTWLTNNVAAVQATPAARVVTVVPDTIPAGGVLWVAGVGGPTFSDFARVRVDVQTLVPGVNGAAIPLAGEAHEAMDALGGSSVGDQEVFVVRCINYPMPRFWSATVDRFTATYQLDLPVY